MGQQVAVSRHPLHGTALAIYTRAGGTGEAVGQVQDEAVPAMQAALEKLRDFFHGCDYVRALDADPRDVLPLYLRARRAAASPPA